MKTVKVSTVYDDELATPMESVILKIEGLREIGNGQFELTNVRARRIDWVQVKSGFGGLTDHQADKIADLLWKTDLVDILTERIGH